MGFIAEFEDKVQNLTINFALQIINKLDVLFQKRKSDLPKFIFKIYTLGNWITHRVDEVNCSEYDKHISDNMGLWIGIIGSVARKISNGDKVKVKTAFLGLNLNTVNF